MIEKKQIRVASVQGFLKAWKKIQCEEDYRLFYRGVSKEQYALREKDYPGIYRHDNWIRNEDVMFYDLVARCPEYFKDCKTTFEHLVMMQHYEYPTRLLDITSNPLVALYFACGGKAGAGRDKKNSENGQVTTYQILKKDIRNYESDRVSLLSNLVSVKSGFNAILFAYKELEKNYLIMRERFSTVEDKVDENQDMFFVLSVNNRVTHLGNLLKRNFVLNDNLYTSSIIPMLDSRIKKIEKLCQRIFNLKEEIESNKGQELCNKLYKDYGLLGKYLQDLIAHFRARFARLNDDFLYEKYTHKIKNEKLSFDVSLINSRDMHTIQCVLPKQNNPRLMAQQGAFLLFGFKDGLSDKTVIPLIPEEMYAKDQEGEKIEIVILGYAKQRILDELKTLGISNSTMFPEIDNIANEIKNQYM